MLCYWKSEQFISPEFQSGVEIMGLKRTTVYLDEDILFLASHHGITTGKLSEFVRKCLEGVVLAEDEIERPDLIRSKAMKIAADMKRELRAQKKLISEQETVSLEVQGYQKERHDAIEAAALKIFLKYPRFSQWLPENDPDFNFVDNFERAISEISKLSRYEADPAEVIRIYHQKSGTRYVGSRLSEDHTPITCDDGEPTPAAIDVIIRGES